jgi:hypothetical protein
VFVFIRALHPRTLMLFEGEGGGGGGEGAGNGAATTFTQDQVNDLLAREKGKITAKFGDYDQLKTKAGELDTLKAASQSDAERLTGEVNSLKGENGSVKAENMRLKVALKKGLTGDKAVLADRLSGATEAEMEADADELLKLFGGGGGSGNGRTGFDGGARGGNGQPQSMDDLIRGARSR